MGPCNPVYKELYGGYFCAQPYMLFWLYSPGLIQDEFWKEYEELYGMLEGVPADVEEELVTTHFPITAAERRAGLPKAEGAYEYYDPATNSYYFMSGYGVVDDHGVT